MTATNHALTGAAVGLVITDTFLAVPLAFLSHFVVDMIPHFSFAEKDLFTKKYNGYLITDLLLTTLLASVFLFAFATANWHVFLCIFAAVIPDIAWAYHRLFQERIRRQKLNYDRFSRIHLKLQAKTKPMSKSGIRNELIWLIGMALIIFIFLR